MELILKNIHACDPVTGLDAVTDISIDGGRIAVIGECKEADRVIDCTGLYAVPGLFDMHVHFRDPGLTYKEDILTGAAAAKAGGVTGVLMMPNSKPPIDNAETIDYVLEKGRQTGINVYTSACITKGMESRELCDYDEYLEHGIFAITDDGKPVVSAELM
ncbi:MAG: amidohydrolase family protein, partial [Ruminococcus sp.]|nr:amidohydrolase family protein [Ruminococcus sp.]